MKISQLHRYGTGVAIILLMAILLSCARTHCHAIHNLLQHWDCKGMLIIQSNQALPSSKAAKGSGYHEPGISSYLGRSRGGNHHRYFPVEP